MPITKAPAVPVTHIFPSRATPHPRSNTAASEWTSPARALPPCAPARTASPRRRPASRARRPPPTPPPPAAAAVKLARAAVALSARAPPAGLDPDAAGQITIRSSKVLDLAGAAAAGGCEAAVASLGVPLSCGGCKVEATRSGDYLFTPPADLAGAREFALPFTVQAACGAAAPAAGDAAAGTLVLTVLPDVWDEPWCPQAWPELRGVGIALSVAFTQTRAADCAAAPFAGGAGNAPAVFGALVADAL